MNDIFLTGMVTLIVCMINNYTIVKTNKEQHNKTMSMLEYKIQQIEKKLEKHNNFVERVYDLEQKATVYEEKIKVVNHRIEDLEDNRG